MNNAPELPPKERRVEKQHARVRMSLTPFSLYLHFPFCSHRCPYCDFNVHVRKQIPEAHFISSLAEEAKSKAIQKEWQGRSLHTIFFGGGTPSLLSPTAIADLLQEIRKLWKFSDLTEITLEANPGTIDLKSAKALLDIGINRLSFGVQSFSDNCLSLLGRNHSAQQAKDAVLSAQQAGFKNINIDLIYAVPQQTSADLRFDIAQALALSVQHLSCYNLTIEAGTPFFERVQAGTLIPTDEDASASLMETVLTELEAARFNHYEISNFALPGYECKHNQAYWNSKDYLGLGPGAHSALSQFNPENKKEHTKRWSNQSTPERYMQNPTDCIAWSEQISGPQLAFELLFLGLRQRSGVSWNDIAVQLEPAQQSALRKLIGELCKEGFMESLDATKAAILTKKGLMIADAVTARFAESLRPQNSSYPN